MKTQNYSNHRRYVPLFHFFTLLGAVILLIGSIVNIVKATEDNFYDASLLVFGSLLLMLTAFYARVFSLKAQDRAIRAEENFRHYVLTGKPFDTQLTMRQIIALRFASDEEFAELAQKAVKENLSEKAIKKSINNWKADTYRA
jgi:FlaA1/EpsC-like NDP-sugar epimerase